jgi:hypothetical protein
MSKIQKLALLGFRRVGGASCYVRICKALPSHMQPGTREVFKLWTDPKHRKRGFATTLMHSICREADIAKITLVLFAEPYFEDKEVYIPQQELEAWYCAEFGFQVIQHEPKLLARAPGATPKVGLRLTTTTRAVIESVRND